jgi:hypothetical protein
MRRAPQQEGGQMLVLAGTVLVLAFLVAAFAVAELGSQKALLEQGPEGALAQDFHQVRGQFAAAMRSLVISTTDNATLAEQFLVQQGEFEERGRSRGVLVLLEMGNATSRMAARTEGDYLPSPPACGTSVYTNDLISYDGTRSWAGAPWDCGAEPDGILWDATDGRIKGMIVHLFVGNEAAHLGESLVIPLN